MERIPVLDLLGCFAVAGELGRGQPAGHVSRTAAIGVAIADRLGLDPHVRLEVFQASLLVHAGCTAGLSEVAAMLLCNEMALQRDVCMCDPANEVEVLRVLLRHAGRNAGSVARLRSIVRLPGGGVHALKEMEAGCSEVGPRIASRLGMPEGTVEALANVCETWNGKGPRKRQGNTIPLAARIVSAAMTAEVFLSSGGRDSAVEAMRKRSGRSLDPAVAKATGELLSNVAFVEGVERAGDWSALKELDSSPASTIAAEELDVLTLACADFADLKVPGSTAHSRRVGQLAEAVMLRLGHRSDSELARRAGHVHAIGQVAMPSELLASSNPSIAESEQLRLHALFTRRVLAHSPGLAPIGHIGAMHHERADGSGYPDGRSGADFPPAARAVAAACAWDQRQTAMTGESLESMLPAFQEYGRNAFGTEATNALCDEIAGARRVRHAARPEGLTDREVEVLALAATGRTIQEIAEVLVISKHTARHHLENIYGKAGVSSRAAATLFAVEAGLLD